MSRISNSTLLSEIIEEMRHWAAWKLAIYRNKRNRPAGLGRHRTAGDAVRPSRRPSERPRRCPLTARPKPAQKISFSLFFFQLRRYPFLRFRKRDSRAPAKFGSFATCAIPIGKIISILHEKGGRGRERQEGGGSR